MLEPFRINQVAFRNRLLKLPQDTAFAHEDGGISPRTLHYYETLAHGGVGAIIVEHGAVDPLGRQERMISLAEDGMIPGLARLADVAHKHQCPIIQQINHLGPMHHSGVRAVSSSALSEEYMRKTFAGATYNLRELTVAAIEDLIEKYARAAERVRDAGFLTNWLGPVAMHRLSKLWMPMGKRVVIIGGLMHGCEIAEFLIKRGRKVSIVESGEQLGAGIIEIFRANLVGWLERHCTAILTGVRYKAVTEKGLLIVDKDGVERLEDDGYSFFQASRKNIC